MFGIKSDCGNNTITMNYEVKLVIALNINLVSHVGNVSVICGIIPRDVAADFSDYVLVNYI